MTAVTDAMSSSMATTSMDLRESTAWNTTEATGSSATATSDMTSNTASEMTSATSPTTSLVTSTSAMFDTMDNTSSWSDTDTVFSLNDTATAISNTSSWNDTALSLNDTDSAFSILNGNMSGNATVEEEGEDLTLPAEIGRFIYDHWPAITITGVLTVVVGVVLGVIIWYLVKKQKGAYSRRAIDDQRSSKSKSSIFSKLCPCFRRKKVNETDLAPAAVVADHGNVDGRVRLSPITPYKYQMSRGIRRSMRLKGVPMIHIPKCDWRPMPLFTVVPLTGRLEGRVVEKGEVKKKVEKGEVKNKVEKKAEKGKVKNMEDTPKVDDKEQKANGKGREAPTKPLENEK